MLMSFFNKISDKGRRRSAWTWGRGREGGGGWRGGEMSQTMYAYVNKLIIK
jgi:hypothetical protein